MNTASGVINICSCVIITNPCWKYHLKSQQGKKAEVIVLKTFSSFHYTEVHLTMCSYNNHLFLQLHLYSINVNQATTNCVHIFRKKSQDSLADNCCIHRGIAATPLWVNNLQEGLTGKLDLGWCNWDGTTTSIWAHLAASVWRAAVRGISRTNDMTPWMMTTT